jgi:hypothetical protein
MGSRSGCGVLGCLVWPLVILLVIAVALAAVVAGLYVLSPRPDPNQIEGFLSARAAGYLEVNLDSRHEGIRAIIHDFEDSVIQPRLQREILRSPVFIRPIAAWGFGILRRGVLPLAIPHAVYDVFYSPVVGPDLRSVGAISSRMPVALMRAVGLSGRLLNLTSGGQSSSITVGGREYRVQSLDHKSLVAQDNWVLLADSLSVLREALSNSGQRAARAPVRRMRAGLDDTSDLTLVLDNQDQVLRSLLLRLEPKILAAIPVGERDVVDALFERAMSQSDHVRSISAQAQVETPDWVEGIVRFELPTSLEAEGFVAFLQLLERFAVPELEKSHVKFDGEPSRDGRDVSVHFTMSGTHGPIMRFVRQLFQ